MIVDGARQLPDALPAQRRVGAAATSRSCRRRSSASTASCRSSSPTTGPCYRCLFPEPPPAELAPSCGANGVLGVLPGHDGPAAGDRGRQADHRRGRPADRPPAALRRAGRDVHRAQGPPRPGLPDLLARARARSPTRRWASSRTTRRSAPRPGRVSAPDGHGQDPTRAAPVRRAARRRSRPTATTVGEVLRRARRRSTPTPQRSSSAATASSTATSTSTSTTRTCACSTGSRRRSASRDTLVILPAMAGGRPERRSTRVFPPAARPRYTS